MAKKLSKRVAANRSKVQPGKLYSVKEAIELVKSCASAKFDESFDVAVQLGIDPKKYFGEHANIASNKMFSGNY